jgi:hypothetical protein
VLNNISVVSWWSVLLVVVSCIVVVSFIGGGNLEYPEKTTE